MSNIQVSNLECAQIAIVINILSPFYPCDSNSQSAQGNILDYGPVAASNDQSGNIVSKTLCVQAKAWRYMSPYRWDANVPISFQLGLIQARLTYNWSIEAAALVHEAVDNV